MRRAPRMTPCTVVHLYHTCRYYSGKKNRPQDWISWKRSQYPPVQYVTVRGKKLEISLFALGHHDLVIHTSVSFLPLFFLCAKVHACWFVLLRHWCASRTLRFLLGLQNLHRTPSADDWASSNSLFPPAESYLGRCPCGKARKVQVKYQKLF